MDTLEREDPAAAVLLQKVLLRDLSQLMAQFLCPLQVGVVGGWGWGWGLEGWGILGVGLVGDGGQGVAVGGKMRISGRKWSFRSAKAIRWERDLGEQKAGNLLGSGKANRISSNQKCEKRD